MLETPKSKLGSFSKASLSQIDSSAGVTIVHFFAGDLLGLLDLRQDFKGHSRLSCDRPREMNSAAEKPELCSLFGI
jgi:hypothetical protein